MSHSIFLKDLIKKYNADPNSFTSDSMFVKSYQVGQSTYFKKVTNSSFWAIRENEALFWLVPKSKLSITEFNLDAIEKVFICRNHDSKSDGKKFILIRPVKLELVPETGDLAFQEKGILDFGMVSETRLTDLEYWVGETEDILFQSVFQRLIAEINNSIPKEIKSLRTALDKLENQQKEQAISSLNDCLEFDKKIEKLKHSERQNLKNLKTDLQNDFEQEIQKQIRQIDNQFMQRVNDINENFTSSLDRINQFLSKLSENSKQIAKNSPEESDPKIDTTLSNEGLEILPIQETSVKPSPDNEIPIENYVAIDKVQQQELNTEIIQVIENFNSYSRNFAQTYRHLYAVVAESRISSINRFQGQFDQPVYLEKHNAGSFLAIPEHAGFSVSTPIYWLFPKPGTKPNEFSREIWSLLFGYEGQNLRQYKLILPAKLVCEDDRNQFRLEAAGEIEFI